MAVFVGQEVAQMTNGLPEFRVWLGSGVSDQCLALGESHFDRAKVRAFGRQEYKPRADIAHSFGRAACGCALLCLTSRTAGSRNATERGLPISDPHIYPKDMEPQIKPHRPPESGQERHALKPERVKADPGADDAEQVFLKKHHICRPYPTWGSKLKPDYFCQV